MEENVEQTEVNAPAAEAEKEESASKPQVSYGKFKDADALLKAYNSLQAEFTKRCQRIKELEGEAVSPDKTQVPSEAPITAKDVSGITEEEKNKVLKDYLKSVLGLKQKAIVMDGAGMGIQTPVSRPKTLAEASELAKTIIKKV